MDTLESLAKTSMLAIRADINDLRAISPEDAKQAEERFQELLGCCEDTDKPFLNCVWIHPFDQLDVPILIVLAEDADRWQLCVVDSRRYGPDSKPESGDPENTLSMKG